MQDLTERLRFALRDRYRVEGEIGHGGMATVFLAHDERHVRQVAIKVLRSDTAENIGADRFSREILVAAKLQHPNILTLIDSGRADGFIYYVMPFVEGESLRTQLARRTGPLPQTEVIRILRDVVEAIAYAHRHGVIHRDIKPDNVMVTAGHALLLDFGIAKVVGAEADWQRPTSTGIAVGTLAYMAPEQLAADQAADHRVDIYAIGVVAHELLTGSPLVARNPGALLAAHGASTPGASDIETSGVSRALVGIVGRCLQEDPADRYQTADSLLAEIDALFTPSHGASSEAGRAGGFRRRDAVVIAAAVIVTAVAGSFAYWQLVKTRRERWVREQTIPAITRLVGANSFDSVWMLADEASAVLPSDPTLKKLLDQNFVNVVLRTEPEGAKVFATSYSDTSHWRFLGTTPTHTVRVPGWPFRLRVEKPGFQQSEVEGLWSGRLVLDRLRAPHSEMVRVDSGLTAPNLPGLGHQKSLDLKAYLIDRDETTNVQFQAFVDSGGYARREYWEYEFVRDGKRLSWQEGIELFKDKTGRSGPATWEAGRAPSGMDDYPVGGVSWYEAAAYAKFAGKSLPTVYHWLRAAEPNWAPWIVSGSTFHAQGPTRRSRLAGMSPYGSFDMAGNMREWCYNAAAKQRDSRGTPARYILGGGWSDDPYMFNIAYAQEPFDRSAINGIRLVIYPAAEPALRTSMEPIPRPSRDYPNERPVSDALFEGYRRLYDYDRDPLGEKVEARDTTAALWIWEKVSIAAGYGNERLQVYLFLPKGHRPPFQTVLFFPGKGAVEVPTFRAEDIGFMDFVLKSGRALVWPVYKSTYERRDNLTNAYPDESVFFRDHMVMWAKDLRRTIDYLETREDIDSSRIGYFGYSWGAALGGIMPAVEPRLKAAVLDRPGMYMERARPEADAINFLPRVTIPVLMLNGTHDSLFPRETSQRPFFNWLGTPPELKRQVLYEGGHFMYPRQLLISEALNWYDKYLGPTH